LLLSSGQEPLSEAASPVLSSDVDLLHLITHDHGESGNRSINDGYGRIAHSLGSSPLKRIGSPRRYQFVWDSTEMGITPTSAPDLRHTVGIAGGCWTKKNQPFVHSTTPASEKREVSFDFCARFVRTTLGFVTNRLPNYVASPLIWPQWP
jgi:hypothetical protein